MIASYCLVTKCRNTLALQFYLCIGLCTWLNLQFIRSINRCNCDLASQRCLCKCNRLRRVKIILLSLESRIPVNKHGSQNSLYARKFDEEFFGELPILTFPAGLCSRCIGGEVTDLPWKTNFLKKAYASQRQIVPVFVEGRLSNFFYRVDRIRRMLGVKFNIEMLWLSDEMFSQKGKHFRILVGDPIPVAELQRYGALRDQADYVRKKAYFLENMLLPAENNG